MLAVRRTRQRQGVMEGSQGSRLGPSCQVIVTCGGCCRLNRFLPNCKLSPRLLVSHLPFLSFQTVGVPEDLAFPLNPSQRLLTISSLLAAILQPFTIALEAKSSPFLVAQKHSNRSRNLALASHLTTDQQVPLRNLTNNDRHTTSVLP